MGHPSNRQTELMISNHIITPEAEGTKTEECDTCLKCKPNRRPVPTNPERSGEIVVQIDYMPAGRDEKGWRGEEWEPMYLVTE